MATVLLAFFWVDPLAFWLATRNATEFPSEKENGRKEVSNFLVGFSFPFTA